MANRARPQRSGRRVRAITVSPNTILPGMQVLAGVRFLEGVTIPDDMEQVVSDTYDATSPRVPGVQYVAVVEFAQGVPPPANMRRVALLPEPPADPAPPNIRTVTSGGVEVTDVYGHPITVHV